MKNKDVMAVLEILIQADPMVVNRMVKGVCWSACQ